MMSKKKATKAAEKKKALDDSSSDDDSSDDDEAPAPTALKVNEKFAAEFEEREQKRLMMKEEALGLGGSDESDDSDASSEDDDARDLTPNLDLEIMKTINAIRRKDVSVYQPNTRFFTEEEAEVTEEKEKKGKTYKELMREQYVAADGDVSKVVEQDPEEKPASALAYNEEQRELKAAFKMAVDSDESDDDMLVAPTAPLRAPGKHSELEEESRVFAESSTSRKTDDAFLADFVANRRWADDVQGNKEDFDDDEDDEEAAEAFEQKYNFRFEQDGGEALVSHARSVDGSLRRLDDARKKARAVRKERKLEERQRKETELRRLKNLKRKELQEQRDRLSEVGVDMDDDDWDPDAHDAKMAAAFDDDYYDTKDDSKDFAKEWSDDEEEAEEEEEEAEEEEEEEAEEEQEEAIPASRSTIEEELDKLDHEDIVGGMPTRFKYRSVPENSYGLTTEELLETDDLDLRQLVSMKKLAPFREETQIPAARRHKWRSAIAQKKKEFDALEAAKEAKKTTKKKKTTEKPVVEEVADTVAGTGIVKDDACSLEEEPAKKRKRKRARQPAAAVPDDADVPEEKKKKKKNAFATKKEQKKQADAAGISKARLSSYGL